jgi:hypothetical protein
MAVYSIQQIINIAKISQYIAVSEVLKNGLWGGGEDLKLGRKLYVIRKSIEDDYISNPSDPTLYTTSAYLYALCAPYSQKAIEILNAGGGGSISPITPSQRPLPLYFNVSDTTPIPTGGNTVTLTQFKGWNIVFSRGGITQTQVVDHNNQYFLWNPITAVLFIYGNATEGEGMTITPA